MCCGIDRQNFDLVFEVAFQPIFFYLKVVMAGARGDAQAGEQAYKIAQALQQPGAPPEYIVLGKGFQRVLEGLRGEDAVQGLPEEAAEAIRLVLQNI